MLSDLVIYLGLFISSFMSSSVFPMTSDGVVAYMVLKGFDAVAVVLIASLGSYLGFCSIYAISYYGREVLFGKLIKIRKDKMDKAEIFFQKYGSPMLFFAWLPFIGEAFVAVGGALKVNFLRFSILTFLGTLARFSLIVYIFLFLR